MVKKVPVLLFMLIVGATPGARAQTVDINFDPSTLAEIRRVVPTIEQDLESYLETEFRALYGLLNVQEFLRLSANAQSMANKGLGVDYASNPDGLIFGAAFTAAADAGDADLQNAFDVDRSVPISAGAQIAAMVGYNFSSQGAPDLTLFVSGAYFPLNVAQLEGQFTNVGIHGQYKLIGEKNAAVIGWGGIDITSGFQFSRIQLTLEDTYRATAPIDGGLELDTRSSGTLELEQRALTVPIEVTTNLTLLKFLTLYAGVGVDFLFGSASANFDLASDLETTIDGTTYNVGDARVTADELADADPFLVRFMGGLQLNFWKLKLFTQLNVASEDAAIGVAVGLRLAL